MGQKDRSGRVIRIRPGESAREKEAERSEKTGAFQYITKKTIVEVLNLEGDARFTYEYTIGNFKSSVSQIFCNLRSHSKMEWEEMDVVAVDGRGVGLTVIPTGVDTPYQKTWQISFPALTRGSPRYTIKSTAKLHKVYPAEDRAHYWEEFARPGTLKLHIEVIVPQAMKATSWSAHKTDNRGTSEDLSSYLAFKEQMRDEAKAFVAQLDVDNPSEQFSYVITWEIPSEITEAKESD